MMNRVLEFLIKLMLLLVLGPAIIAMLLQCTAEVIKMVLPWVIVAIFLTGIIAGVFAMAALKRRLPPAPLTSSNAHGFARPAFVKRPRGHRGRAD